MRNTISPTRQFSVLDIISRTCFHLSQQVRWSYPFLGRDELPLDDLYMQGFFLAWSDVVWYDFRVVFCVLVYPDGWVHCSMMGVNMKVISKTSFRPEPLHELSLCEIKS